MATHTTAAAAAAAAAVVAAVGVGLASGCCGKPVPAEAPRQQPHPVDACAGDDHDSSGRTNHDDGRCQTLVTMEPALATTIIEGRSPSGSLHEGPLELPELLRRRASSFAEAKLILEDEFDLELAASADESLFIVNYKPQSPLWTKGSPLQRRVLSQSRGAIFDRESFRCVCLPFLKFWSVNERLADPIPEPWHAGAADGGVVVGEKLDGALTKLFFHRGSWRLASNTTLSTDEPRKSMGGRSHWQLFEDAALASAGVGSLAELYERLDTDCCYMFERLHPEAVIVVPVAAPRLVHVGTRNMRTLRELHCSIGVEQPRRHVFPTLRACVDAAAVIPWSSGEGYVVTDRRCAARHSWPRLKVKSFSYLRVHHAITGTLAADPVGFCVDTWLAAEEGEILAAFPQFKGLYAEVEAALEVHVVAGCVEAFNELVAGAGGERSAFFKSCAVVPGPPWCRPILKAVASSLSSSARAAGALEEVRAADVVRVLRRRENNNAYAHRTRLKQAMLTLLPPAVSGQEILGARGENGLRGVMP